MLPDDGRRPEHEGAILVCILMYILKLIQFKKKTVHLLVCELHSETEIAVQNLIQLYTNTFFVFHITGLKMTLWGRNVLSD